MEKIRQFDLLESYNEAYDSLRVNTVSKTIDNKKVWFKPRNKITAYYNVTDTSSATRILGDDFDTSQIRYMVVDGVKVYPTYYDETEEQVIEAYNMEEQSYATMSLNLDDDDMDYRQHIVSPNEGYGEIMTTMALNNDVLTYDVNLEEYYNLPSSLNQYLSETQINQLSNTSTYDVIIDEYVGVGIRVNEVIENDDKINDIILNKFEKKGESFINCFYNFNSIGEHCITFVFKECLNTLNNMFKECKQLVKVLTNKWGKSAYSFGSMFYNCTNLKEAYLNKMNLSKAMNISNMFMYCGNMTILECEDWDVSNLLSMGTTFYKCSSLKKLDLSKWDVSKCETFSFCFSYCTFGMADKSQFNISTWDTSGCLDMSGMFEILNFDEFDISHFNTSKVTNMSYMFDWNNRKDVRIKFPQNFGSACKSMKQMMANGIITTIDFTNWNTTLVEDFSNMFKGSNKLVELDLSTFDTSNATDISHMFHDCTSLKNIKGIDNFKTNNVKTISNIFQNCKSLIELDLSKWDVSNVIYMNDAFQTCSNLETLNISTWNTEKNTTFYWTFAQCYKLKNVDFSSISTKNATSTRGMFFNCKSLEEINVSHFDVSNVIEAKGMFEYMHSLKKLEIPNYKFNSVTLLDNFIACGNLEYLDISNFEAPALTSVGNVFEGIGKLKKIDISSWSNMNNLRTYKNMFYAYDTNLKSFDFGYCDYPNLTSLYNFFGKCSKVEKIRMLGNMEKLTTVTEFGSSFQPYGSFIYNPKYNYEIIVNSLPKKWYKIAEPNEVNFTVKLYNSFNNNFITTKTLSLKQDVYDELVCSDMDNISFVDGFLTSTGEIGNNSDFSTSDFIEVNNCLSILWRNDMGGNTTHTIIEYNENKEIIKQWGAKANVEKITLEGGNSTKYIRYTIKKGLDDIFILDETNHKYLYRGNDVELDTYRKYNTTNIITSTYDEELDGYPFIFVAYNNQYSIYEEGSETPIGEIMTYNNETTLIYGDINNVSYDIIATYKLSTSGSTTLFNESFSKDNLMVMVVDDNQIPLKSNKYTFEDTNEHIVKIKLKEKPTAYDLQYMFNGCSAMTSCDLSNLDTSEVTSMYGMFQGCTSLSSVTFGSNDTTNVANISNMFYNCSALTSLDLTMFNNIVNINTLCYGCSKLTELKFNCDFSKVESYGNLLGNVTTNGVLYYNNSYESDNILYSLPSTWTFNPAQIINVSIELVENGSTVTDGSLHTITVADNTGTFNTETNLYDFSISVNSYKSASIKVDGVEQLNFVLVKGKTYKVFLGDTSSYDGFSIEMVYVPTTTTGPTQLFNSSFDLSQIYTMFIDGVMQTSVVSAYTFSDTNEHKVQCMTHDMTSMYYMFYNSNQLKSVKFGDSFNTSNVYTMYRAFRNCSNITEIDLSKLDLTNVESMNGLFYSCSNLKKVVLPENFGVNCVEMSYMFNYCYVLDDLNYENLNMSNCKTASYMFCGTSFETFDASIFDMTNMIVCEGMFSQMEKLKSIDISGWNITNGNSCVAILANCTSLETVIMDNAYINARNLYAMFYNCTSLKEIDFSNSLGFYGDDFASFFYGCTNLKTIKGIDKLHPKAYTNYVFQNCESLTSIDLSSWDMSNVLRINDMFSNCKKLTDVTIYSSLDNVSDYANMFSGVTTDGVLNYNIIHEEKILDMFVTNQKVSNFPTSWRLNSVTLEKTYVLTLITNDAYVKNATVSLNNVVGVYNESNYTYTFENIQVTSRQLPLIVDGIEVSQVDESKLVQYVYYGTNDELYTLIDFTTPTFDTSVIIENDATYPWAYNEELGFLTSTMHEHNVVTYVTINSGIIGDATITLYQKNESESDYDYSAIFNSSNEIIYNLQGINSDNIVVNVNTEDGILKFGYQKDYSYSEGTDCLGIKKIEGTKLPEE